MKDKEPVSTKWNRKYTFLLLANFIYLLLFYWIMTVFS